MYEEAFRTAGFSSWKIEPFLIPPDSEDRRGEGFWDEYVAAPSAMHIICRKQEPQVGCESRVRACAPVPPAGEGPAWVVWATVVGTRICGGERGRFDASDGGSGR